MLYDDMQRSKAGRRPQYILFSPPERIESQKERPQTVAMKAMRSAGCTLQQIGETFTMRRLFSFSIRCKAKTRTTFLK
jgi:hypothetical protein